MNKKIHYLFRYLFWTVNRLFVYTYIRPKFNLVTAKNADRMPKPPFIIISNHGTFFDPWLVGHYSKYPLSIMMNEDGFKAAATVRWYLSKIGTFPKKKGESDYKAMKTALKELKLGYPLLIFPEGQTTWDGETQPIFPGIEKIVKRADISLVMMNIKGDFLSKPWWAENYRKGKVRVFRKVLNPIDIKAMSENELLDMIIKYIYQNDLKDKENLQIKFSGKNLTAGLERFVWICKNCKKEDTLYTSNNDIACSSCGASWNMDTHLRLKAIQTETAETGDLHDWSTWHKKILIEKIKTCSEDKLLTKSSNVIYCSININGKYIPIAEGTLSLTKKLLTFQPNTGNEHLFQLDVNEINDYVFQRKDTFECRCKEKSYRFRFTGHSPMKWVYYLRYLHNYEDCERRGYI